jgi:hypothetical protein
MNAIITRLEEEAWGIARAALGMKPGQLTDPLEPVPQALIAIACRLGDTTLLKDYGRRADNSYHKLAMTLTEDATLVQAIANLLQHPMSATYLYLKGQQLWNAVGQNEAEIELFQTSSLALILLGLRAAGRHPETHPLEALAYEALLDDPGLREHLPPLEEAFDVAQFRQAQARPAAPGESQTGST